jgi:hypothetical protein
MAQVPSLLDFGPLPRTSPLLALRLKNFLASVTVVALACAIYAFAPYNQQQIGGLYSGGGLSFTGSQFLLAAAVTYAMGLGFVLLTVRQPGFSKSLRFFRVVWFRQGLSTENRVAVLATLLKTFFGPMMVMSLMGFCMGALTHGAAFVSSGAFAGGLLHLFNQHGFWFLMQLFFFVDVLVFSMGYLVESPRLGNEIRSVDPTLLGWAAALMCYPPFNGLTGSFLGSVATEFPKFDNPNVHVLMNMLLLVLMAGYTLSSLSLGFKASILTHRGIVSKGTYAWVRHPAYTCKSLAWLIGSIPALAAAFALSLGAGLQAGASALGWMATTPPTPRALPLHSRCDLGLVAVAEPQLFADLDLLSGHIVGLVLRHDFQHMGPGCGFECIPLVRQAGTGARCHAHAIDVQGLRDASGAVVV